MAQNVGKRIPKTFVEHDHDQDGVSYDTSIPGVLTSGELHRLERAKGAAFTQAWLRKLIAHEQEAVKLAADAIEDEQNADVVAFAQKDETAHPAGAPGNAPPDGDGDGELTWSLSGTPTTVCVALSHRP